VIEETFPIGGTPSDISLTSIQDSDRVLSWRIFQLSRVGYSDGEAVALACAADVDLHMALELRARGCPAVTALRILL